MGWIQDIPWFYLLVGASVLFAAISTGLLRFDEWIYRNRVKDKLTFQMIRAGKSLDDNGSVKSIRLGF